jgi:phosphoribosyl 1,2-cyclic phosphate phosphodiesterase
MKITFLGTGSAELYPGIWCQCDYCTYAREKGGRNIRFTSSIHFADTCLVDFPADIANKALLYGLDLLPVNLMLCTHSHEDHFDPQMLYWRYREFGVDTMPEETKYDAAPASRYKDLPLLSIYGNRKILKKMEPIFRDKELADYALDFHLPEAYREYHQNGVDFIPMIASHHDRDGERGLIYWIRAQGKSFLYATDSDTFIDRTRDCIKANKVDAVIMEATGGLRKGSSGHMNLERAKREVEFFCEKNIFTGEPKVIFTHLSPHRTPPHDLFCKMLEGTCMEPAYDGMALNL